jgi:hypothetical protein
MANNTTHDHLQTLGNSILLASVVFKFIAMIIGVLGNITVIISTLFSKRDRAATSFLVANLALADLLVCLTFYPIWIIELVYTILDINSDQDLFCKLSRSTTWALLVASLGTLLAITVDRYFYIVKPLKYPMIVTKKRVFKVIAVVWLISCSFYIFMHIHWRKYDHAELRSFCLLISNRFFVLLSIAVGCLPLIVIFVLNFQIFNVARKQRKRILAETAVAIDDSSEQSSRLLMRLLHFLVGLKAAKTFCIVVMVLAFCVATPTIIGVTLEGYCRNSCLQFWYIWYVAFCYEFYGLNSVVNAFIYGMRHIKYRKAYGDIPFKIFRCRKRRDPVENV